MAVGFSWAHLLGDAVSASNFINHWGQLLSGKELTKKFQLCNQKNEVEKPVSELDSMLPSLVKQVKPVEDFWQHSNIERMATISIELTLDKLNDLQSKISTNISIFETLAALLWQNIAKVRAKKEPKLVTLCKNSTESDENLGNKIKVKTVVANSSPAKAELLHLAKLVNEETVDEMKAIQEIVDRESEKLDVILYGSNLTFVDMESINLYELALKGQKPVHVEYSIDGVGEEGTVLVLQGHASTSGRVISIILPEEEIPQLKELLKNDWGIA